MARQKASVIMPQQQKGGLESALPVIGGLVSMYYGGDYGTGSAVGGGLTNMYKGGSGQGTGALSSGNVAQGQGSSVSGGLQAGGMQVAQGAMGAGGTAKSSGPTTSNMQTNLGSMDGVGSGMTEGPSMAGAMDRRYESYSSNPQTDIDKGLAGLNSLPKEQQDELRPVLERAKYQASQRPAGSTAPTTTYIQDRNRRY